MNKPELHISSVPLLMNAGSQQLPDFDSLDSQIFQLFQKTLEPHFSSKDRIPNTKKATVSKVILGTGGVLGRIPLIPLSSKFLQPVPFVGPFFATTNFVSYSAYLVWASSRMINQISYQLNCSEKYDIDFLDKCKKLSLIAFNVINGIAAQMPYFVLSYDYNPQRPYMVALNAMDVTLPTYSLQLMTQNKLSLFNQKIVEKKLSTIQLTLSSYFQNALKALIHNPDAFHLDAILFKSSSPSEKINELLDALSTLQAPPQTSTCLKHNHAENLSKILGFMLLGVQMAWFAFLCKQGLDKITDQQALIGVFCTYVVICNIALTHFVLVGSSYQAIQGASKLFSKIKSPTYLLESLSPKASFTAKVISMVICMTAIIPAAQMSQDYLPTYLYYPSTIAYGLGFVLMDYLPLRDLLNDALTMHLQYKGSDREKKVIALYQRLEECDQIIQNASLKSMALFLLKLEKSNLISGLLSSQHLKISTLSHYVCPHEIPSIEVI